MKPLLIVLLLAGAIGAPRIARAYETNVNFAVSVIASDSTNSPVIFQPSVSNNYTRVGIIIVNDSGEDLYLAKGWTVATNGVFLLKNGGVYQNLAPERVYQGPYAARSAVTNGAARVVGIEDRVQR